MNMPATAKAEPFVIFDGVILFPKVVRSRMFKKCESPKCENLVWDNAICRDCEDQVQQFAEVSHD